MHSAPSVSFPVGRCVLHERACAAMAVLAGASIALAWPHLSAVQVGLVAMTWVVWCLFAVRALQRHPRGRLVFHAPTGAPRPAGHAWSWQGSGTGAIEQPIDSPALVIDLQACLLLRLAPAPGVPAWIWVEAGQAPRDWLALRRALLWAAGQGAGEAEPSGIVPRA